MRGWKLELKFLRYFPFILLKWVKNRVHLPDGEPMVVFWWLLRRSLTGERRNSEGIRRETERQDRGKGVLGVSLIANRDFVNGEW
jgi:hypothetical protein